MLRLSLLLTLALAHLLSLPSGQANQADCAPKADSLVPLEAEARQLIEALRTPCADYALNEARQQYERSFPPSQARIKGRVGGFLLRGTKEEIEIGRKALVGRLPSNWLKAARDCKDVKCALGNLFGSQEAGLRTLSLAKDTGYVISASQELSSPDIEKLWSSPEIRSVDRAVRKLPSKFWHLKTMERLFRGSSQDPKYPRKFYGFARPGTFPFPGHIIMMDTYFGESANLPITLEKPNDYLPEQSVIHELSHHFDYSNGGKGKYFSKTSAFSGLSEWKASGPILPFIGPLKSVPDPEANFPSDYAMTAPVEDFAEAVMFYVEFPTLLKERAPEKYEFLKQKVFDGVEYPARGDWPLAEKTLAANRGLLRSSLTSCVGRILSIELSQKASACALREGFSGSTGHGCNLSARFKDSDCIQAYARKIDEELQKDPQYCKYQSRGLAEYYSTGALGNTMNHISFFLEGLHFYNASEEGQKKLAGPCGPNAQRDPACVLMNYISSQTKNAKSLDKLDPVLRQAILDHLALVLKL